MFVKKFLGLFPLRRSCLVLAYTGIASSVIVLGWFTFYYRDQVAEIAKAVNEKTHPALSNTTPTNEQYDSTTSSAEQPGEQQYTEVDEELAIQILAFVYQVFVVSCYFFVHILFIIFSIFLAIGVHKNMRGLVKAYFVYGFFHFFFMLGLALLHYIADQYLETALVISADVFFAFCLCGVKGMMDRINKGKVYYQSAEVGFVQDDSTNSTM